jgi:hypothetical protein
MTEATIKAGVAAVVAKLAGYTSGTNVTEDDYRVLANGSDKYAIVTSGDGSSSEVLTLGTSRTVMNRWAIELQVLVPLRAQAHGDAEADVIAETDAVLAELHKWPELDGVSGVVEVQVGNPLSLIDTAQQREFVGRMIPLMVQEVIAVALSE